MDVPLILIVEFMVFLAYDGKLESNSDMEKELFSSAINQLKERSSMFPCSLQTSFILVIYGRVSFLSVFACIARGQNRFFIRVSRKLIG